MAERTESAQSKRERTTPTEVGRRHYSDHPLRLLTDDELRALADIAKAAWMFNERLASQLSVIGELVSREESDRTFVEQTKDLEGSR